MTLLYDFVKVPVYLTHAAYFRKVHVLNADNVPVDKPVMLLPNHPNAFLDAVVVSIQLHQQVNFLVRSDVFNTPLKKWLLAKLNNYPIYRIQEGTENLKKNEETFRLCSKLFKQKKTILIFPEGICIREKRLRKLKKGAARIAFGSEDQCDFSLDLHLVPVGVNYSRFGSIGGEMILNYGKPISLAAYKEMYANEKAKAINDLTSKIENELSELVIRVPSEDEDALFNQFETFYFKANESGYEKFSRKKQITSLLSELKQNHPDKLNELQEKAASYFSDLVSIKSSDAVVAGYTNWNIIKDLMLLVTFPFCFFGALFNLIPYKLSYALSNKVVGKEEFFDSVNMIGGMFIFLIYYILLGVVSSFFIDNGYYLLIMILAVPLSGMLTLWWNRQLRKRRGQKNFSKLSFEEQTQLKDQRKEILSLLKIQS